MAVGFQEAGQAMVNPFINLWNSFVRILPGLIAAIIVLFIGFLIGKFCGFLAEKILQKIGLDKRIDRSNLSDALGKFELSNIIGFIVKWYVVILFLNESVALVNLGTVSILLSNFLFWLPNLIVALIILVCGLVFADYISEKFINAKVRRLRMISTIVRAILIFIVFIVALKQAGLYIGIAESTFLILIGGVSLALALAVGISFGFALKDEAKDMIRCMKKHK